jgi:hypothetical protein
MYVGRGSACLIADMPVIGMRECPYASAREDWPALIIPGDTGVLPDPSEPIFARSVLETC